MHALLRLLMFHLLLSRGPNALGDTIINGKAAPENSMLYMASVQKCNSHQCGGFLINKDFVLTAAHCYNESLTVVLGTHNLKKVQSYMRYSVCSHKHPKYQGVSSGYDIMLLKLLNKAPQNKSTQTIQIPKTAYNLKGNTKCQVAGWGLTKNRGRPTDVLQVADVPAVDMEVCRTEWEKERNLCLPKDVFCAGGYGKNGETGFCQGDSGGPLVCGKQAVGIVSFNMERNCDYPNLPNVYVDISKHLRWIKDILKKNTC